MSGESRDSGHGVLLGMDSSESRWVFQDEDENGEDLLSRVGLDSEEEEEEENGEQRLIRTGPHIDSFDVEALEVPGAQRNDYEDFSMGRKIVQAFQTLGVVFGDVGTSPLYTFGVMFNKSPIHGEEDVLGALSLVLFTLILIPLIKYVLVVLWANDDGEGMQRHAKVSLLPNQLPSDSRISSFRLKVPSAELERSLKVKERLETSQRLKKLLLMLVLAGTSMVIADGVVTPTMSVMSAVSGLKLGISGVRQDEVKMISVAFLVILFSVQRFGTSKVGLAVGPALFIWFCSLGGIGIYNLVKYDRSVLRAFNPVHIYYFFKKNSTQAWIALGGCLLCATGSEAMFADLCYFSVRSVQLTFLFLVLPCLLLGYLGQAAFLMKNQTKSDEVFFSSIPSIAELGVMMVTTILVTIVMLLIWQINIVVVLSFLVCFLGMELVFFSSVLWSVGDGSWIILVFAAVIFFIMFIWNYGSKLKYETEVKQKLSMDLLLELGSDLGTVRAPGIGLVYNELVKGVPAIFGHFLTTLPAIHSMIIFVCIKYVPVSVVPQNERFLFRRVCPRSYHIFRCIARYGYKDVRKENHATFEQLLIESLEKFIRREAQERSLESDDEDDVEYEKRDARTKLSLTPNGSVCSLGEPLLADYLSTGKSAMEASTSSVEAGPSLQEPMMSEAQQTLERELSFIHKAKESGMVYLLGHGDIRARKDSWFFKKLVINYFYSFLRRNCRRGIATLSVPHTHLMQVGMTYMV
ncbi:hypothetical protein AAC387_Pa01g0169 [Persea americana]